MLNILTDPAGIAGREQHEWDYGISLQANIERHLSSGAECELRLNGDTIDPLTDTRMDLPPCVGDVVIVVRRPGAVGAFIAAYWVYIAYAVALIYILTNLPKTPGSSASAAGKDSPNNSLTSQTNVARAYQAIPDVYGYRRCWPDLIQASTVVYVDHIKFVTEWLCISRGVGTVTSVQYAESPIGDIEGSSYELFTPAVVGGEYPELATTTILDVIETFASAEVNGQELPALYTAPSFQRIGVLTATLGATTFQIRFANGSVLDPLISISGTGTAQVSFVYDEGLPQFSETCSVVGYVIAGGNITFTFSSSAWASDQIGVDIVANVTPNKIVSTPMGPYTLPVEGGRIRWNTVFLRGLIGSVVVKSEWWKIDSGGVEVPGTREDQEDTYSANTYDQRFWTTEVTPAGGYGRYRIEFTRLTNPLGSGGADVAKLESAYAVRHYPEKVLPGVTIIRVTTKATNEATGFSERKFNLRWARWVRTLTGEAQSASRNFARSLVNMWAVAGYDVEEIDTDALAAINAEHGEDSPLLRFDGSLDDNDMSLGERMQLIASTARCSVWRDGTKWTATREQVKPYPELQLDYRNLSSKGDSVIGYAAHLPASNDGVEIEYVDEVTQAKKSYVRLNISTGAPVVGTSDNPKKIRLIGCATVAQATNRAHLEARRLLYQRTTVTDTALADGGALGIGSLARWIDPNDFAGDDGLQAGEVMSIVGNVITTSERLDWKGETTGRIMFTGVNGLHLGAPIVCTPTGNSVTLASVPAGLFVASADRQCGSRYAFAVGLTQSEVENAGLYTTTEIKPAADGTVALSLASYDIRMFEED